MSFPRYERYLPSDIPWIKELPANWKTQRLKTVFQLMARPIRDEDEIITAFRDGEVTLRANRRQEGFTNALQEIGYQGVRKDDLVIHAMDAFAGAIGVSDSDGKSTPVYSVCRPLSAATKSKYYGALLRYMAVSGFINSLAKGIRERSTDFRWSDAGNVLVPVPSEQEQVSIISFIEQETAKIDALIEEQRRLIELLKEKRQAVISHAVTKGLNPDTRYKDSGLASFGFVPSHWAIRKIHALAKVGNGSTPSRERFDYWDGGEYPWLSSTVVNQEEVTQADQFVTEVALKECHLPIISPPAVLIGITGQGKTRGMATTLRFEATINQHIAAVVPRNSELDIEFLRCVFDMLYLDLRTDSEGGGSTKGAITCEQIQCLRIALPSIAEQVEIASWIRMRNEEFVALTGQAASAIGLLQERRSALISAAVTGKIDVRNYTPKEAA